MSLALSLPQLGLSVAAGGLTTLSPCVFPLLPLVLGGAVQGHRLAPVAMGLGMMLSFAFALVMLVPALSDRFSRWMLPIASAANAASTRLDGGSLLSAAALGAVLGLVWSPCSGPLLGSALTLVASEGGALRGGVVLALFGLGAATPLVAVAYASRSGFMRARDWILARVERVRRGFAVLLGGMGVAILTGADKWVEARVLAWLPDAWVNLTIGI
jgi:cytochrome c-type biogenesis protein